MRVVRLALAMLSTSGAVAGAAPATAQDRPALRSADLTVGLYFSNRPSLNGPHFHLRHLVSMPAAAPVAVGLRLEFRDDDQGGGRVQALGLGGDLVLGMQDELPFYLVAGVQALAILTGGVDAATGLTGTASAGVGVVVDPVLIEACFTIAPGWRSSSIGLGLRSRASTREPPRAAVEAQGGGFVVTNERYRPTDGFRGYALSYERQLGGRIPAGARGSFGIAFLDFGFWSTGAVTLLLGLPLTVLDVGSLVRVRVVPETGIWVFFEPRQRAYPLLRLGPEVVLGSASIGVAGGG